jgi:predicted RNase H-like HicB family nuclease
MSIRKFTASLSKEGKIFVAQCLEVDVASQGSTEGEALQNLQEALELHFEHPTANDLPKLKKLEIRLDVA